jgi:hypothetical protein
MNFCARNASKLTYEHLEVKIFSGGYAPWTPGRRGGERKGKGRRTGEEGEGWNKGEDRLKNFVGNLNSWILNQKFKISKQKTQYIRE